MHVTYICLFLFTLNILENGYTQKYIMDTYLSSQLRKIQLTRSEPSVHIKMLKEHEKNSYTTKFCSGSRGGMTNQPRPPNSVRPKMTVVSPIRRVRIPTQSYNDLKFRNDVPDGESSNCSNEDEKISLKIRLPADGCNSDESESDDDSIGRLINNYEDYEDDKDPDDDYLEDEIEEGKWYIVYSW